MLFDTVCRKTELFRFKFNVDTILGFKKCEEIARYVSMFLLSHTTFS